MIKVDFNYKFKNLDGTPIPERPPEIEEDEETGKMKEKKYPTFTLKTCCINVLTMQPMQERGKSQAELSGKQKVERYEFAKRIYECKGLLDITPEEQVLLKELIGKAYPPITVGQAFEILDPHSVGKNK